MKKLNKKTPTSNNVTIEDWNELIDMVNETYELNEDVVTKSTQQTITGEKTFTHSNGVLVKDKDEVTNVNKVAVTSKGVLVTEEDHTDYGHKAILIHKGKSNQKDFLFEPTIDAAGNEDWSKVIARVGDISSSALHSGDAINISGTLEEGRTINVKVKDNEGLLFIQDTLGGSQSLGIDSKKLLRFKELNEKMPSGQVCRLPYFFKVDYATDKAIVKDYTISLDGNYSLEEFSLTIDSATKDQAGLMKATDKIILDDLNSSNATKGAIRLLGPVGEPGSETEAYNFPFDIQNLRYDLTDHKIKATLKTITLDNTFTKSNFPLELELPEIGKVDDVKVDGTSVVTNRIAEIDLTNYVKKLGKVPGTIEPQDFHLPYFANIKQNETDIKLDIYTVNINDGTTKTFIDEYVLPAVSTTKAGIMTAQDKINLDNKVDKVTTQNQLYGTKKVSGAVVQTTLGYSNTPNPSHIVQYDNAGRVRVDNTNLDASGNANCATPVSYVKNNFVGKFGKPAGSTENNYWIPYHFTTKFENNKIKIHLFTIDPDSKALKEFDDELEIPTAAQEQADWNQTDTTKLDYIKNKPTKATSISGSGVDTDYVTSKAVVEYISSLTGDNTDY